MGVEILTIVRDIETGNDLHRGEQNEALSDSDFLHCSSSGFYPWFSQKVKSVDERIARRSMSVRPESESTLSDFKIHHYFDYVAGTSTGALSAIMLSRMKLSIDEALAQYDAVGNKVFGNPRTVHFDGKLLSKYHPKDMKAAVLSIIETQLGEERKRTQTRSDKIPLRNENPEACHTMVIAHGDKLATPRDAYMFRSYDHPFTPRTDTLKKTGTHLNAGPAHTARLWEIAQATSAAPGYFSKVKIEGRVYRDGGLGSNNHSSLAFSEVHQMHGMRPPALVLSIGTGAPPQAVIDRDPDHTNDAKRSYWLFNHPRDMLDVVGKLRKLATDSHDTHLNVQKDVTSSNNFLAERRKLGDPGSEEVLYYRFDAPGISDIHLDDWTPRRGGSGTKERLRKATVDDYLSNPKDHPEVRRQLIECATRLVEIRQRRSATERWEQFATQTTYTCPEIDKCYSIVFPSRERLRQHSFETHGVVWPVSLDQSQYLHPTASRALLGDGLDAHLLCIWDECGQCPAAFGDKAALEIHMRIKHGKGGTSDPQMWSSQDLEMWLDRGRSTAGSGNVAPEPIPTQEQNGGTVQAPQLEAQGQIPAKTGRLWPWSRRPCSTPSKGKEVEPQHVEMAVLPREANGI
ncbi:hypothetical protein LTR85_003213 [Meristemomyces frigidus]|nr:hypothetical protein LTR85_003213 [Meristemomyces frigidus]